MKKAQPKAAKKSALAKPEAHAKPLSDAAKMRMIEKFSKAAQAVVKATTPAVKPKRNDNRATTQRNSQRKG